MRPGAVKSVDQGSILVTDGYWRCSLQPIIKLAALSAVQFLW